MALVVERLEERLAPAVLIPVATRRDHVYDSLRQILCITTSSGTLERYDVANQRLLSPINVGNALAGLDITPDGAFVYVADTLRLGEQAFVRKVNLTTGAVTNLAYQREPYEGGSWDVAITDNGKAIFDGTFEGGGRVPVRQIDLATDTLSIRADTTVVMQNTDIYRGSGRSLLYLAESTIDSGPVRLYDATTDTFTNPAGTGSFLSNALTTIDRTGTLIATEVGNGASVMTRTFGGVENLTGMDGGLAFDPVRDVLYVADSAADQVVAFDTNTWRELYRLPIGENIPASRTFDNGVMSVSDDGRFLFLSTPAGIRLFDLPVLTADDGDAAFSATKSWIAYDGAGFQNDLHYTAPGNGLGFASWTFAVSPGLYRVSATWIADPDLAPDVTFHVLDGDKLLSKAVVDQTASPDDLFYQGTGWKDLGGHLRVSSSTLSVLVSDLASGYVFADAVRVERIGDLTGSEIQLFDASGEIASGSGSVSFPGTLTGRPLERTFIVYNAGTSNLVLGPSISLPGGFSLVSGFGQTTLGPGESTTFTVRLTAGSAGLFSGAIVFATNDTDENPFRFFVRGAVTSPSFISVPNRRAHVFDPVRQVLFVGTAAGTIERYNLKTGLLLEPLRVGNSLYGLDITPDGNFLYVAEEQRNVFQGFVRKVDLTTGLVTNLGYDRNARDGGTWALAIANNGRALFTTAFQGPSRRFLRQIDLATDEISRRQDTSDVLSPTHIYRGADHSRFFLVQPSGEMFTYISASDTLTRWVDLGGMHHNTLATVSRDGQLIAMQRGAVITILDSNLTILRTLSGFGGGVAFHPTRNILVAIDSAADQIVGLNTITWTESFRVPIGENVPTGSPFANGVISFNTDGTKLFLSTPSGVRAFEVPGAAPSGAPGGAPGGGTLPPPLEEFAADVLVSRPAPATPLAPPLRARPASPEPTGRESPPRPPAPQETTAAVRGAPLPRRVVDHLFGRPVAAPADLAALP